MFACTGIHSEREYSFICAEISQAPRDSCVFNEAGIDRCADSLETSTPCSDLAFPIAVLVASRLLYIDSHIFCALGIFECTAGRKTDRLPQAPTPRTPHRRQVH